MRATFEGWRIDANSPRKDVLAALRAVNHTTKRTKLLLGYTPVARLNPFQAQLYRGFADESIAAAPIYDPWRFDEILDAVPPGTLAAVHFHWLSFVLGAAATPSEAAECLTRFESKVRSYRARGGRIAWTVHNLLPHDAEHHSQELRLRRFMAENADVIHVMSRATTLAVTDQFEVRDEQLVVSKHPDYDDCYARNLTKSEARIALGIEPDEIVFVMFGAIKPYKGIATLLDSFDNAVRSTDRRLRLLIAGSPDGSKAAAEFVDRATVAPNVLIAPRKIPSDQVQVFLRAADVGVAPYDRVLNSGAAILYSTFDLDIVVPDFEPLHEALKDEPVVYFKSSVPNSLTAAILESVGNVSHRAGTTRARVERDAHALSRKLGSQLLVRLDESRFHS